MDQVEHASTTMVEALSQRLLEAALGCADLLSIHLGDRLGWYRSLRDDGPATAAELAARTGTHPRYAREWLEQQAVTGLLDLDRSDAAEPNDPSTRRFSLPEATAEVLTDDTSLAYLAPLARMFAASAAQLPALIGAYRTGGGVSWQQFGQDARESQADMNRPWFESALASALAAVPDLHERLQQPGARIADVGCGAGWSSIALARAYPEAVVEGFDVDAPSLAAARQNARGAAVSSRVQFHDVGGADMPATTYDAIFAFECLHDMPYPVAVLTTARRALVRDGFMVVMDEAVAEALTVPGDELERLMYGFSLLICLPDGMSHPDSAGTGTVMRQQTLTRYAQEAGFQAVSVLPISDFGFWRFYRLDP